MLWLSSSSTMRPWLKWLTPAVSDREGAVVAADVVVQEGDRDAVLVAVAVELALAGAREAGVEDTTRSS